MEKMMAEREALSSLEDGAAARRDTYQAGWLAQFLKLTQDPRPPKISKIADFLHYPRTFLKLL